MSTTYRRPPFPASPRTAKWRRPNPRLDLHGRKNIMRPETRTPRRHAKPLAAPLPVLPIHPVVPDVADVPMIEVGHPARTSSFPRESLVLLILLEIFLFSMLFLVSRGRCSASQSKGGESPARVPTSPSCGCQTVRTRKIPVGFSISTPANDLNTTSFSKSRESSLTIFSKRRILI